MQVHFDTSSVDDYKLFLKVKQLPSFNIVGHVAAAHDNLETAIAKRQESERTLFTM